MLTLESEMGAYCNGGGVWRESRQKGESADGLSGLPIDIAATKNDEWE